MKKFLPFTLTTQSALLAAIFAFLFNHPAWAQSAFTPGDLVVSTYGVGGGFLDGVPTPISLMEFTTSGTFVQTVTLPTTDVGSNYGIVGEYGSSSEANLQLSADGRQLLIAGYQADASYADVGGPVQGGYSNVNGTALAQSTSANVPRVVAVINVNGVANTSTTFNNIFDQNNPRSVWSQNGTSLYLAGQGSGFTDQGIFHTTLGNNSISGSSPAPAQISASTAFGARIVTAYSGNLFYSTDVKNTATGIFKFSGIPTSTASAAQITPANNGLSGASQVNYSPSGFFFANNTTLYVADTGAPKNKGVGDGGIQKWAFNGSNWVLEYTLVPSNFIVNYNDKTSSLTDGEIGFASLTGRVVNGSVQLFGTSYTIGDADQDALYAITDPLSATTNPGDSFTTLQTAPGVGANSGNLSFPGGIVFKSVSFAPAVPEPSIYALLGGVFALVFAAFQRKRK